MKTTLFQLLVYFTLSVSWVFAQSFGVSNLDGISINNPTCLQFGPDGRLYTSEQEGTIYAYSIERNGSNDYEITATETILEVKNNTPNHDDDGTPNDTQTRQITGLLVVGTASNPILYVSSSDWRIGGGGGGSDVGLDTNSGVVSRLTKNGNDWDKVDLIRGLPRSEENHATNGLQLDEATNTLYVASGGSTNAGSPSNNFAFITEYALSAAILEIDLDVIDNMNVLTEDGVDYVYNLPTLDDPTRSNSNGEDQNDPFGGNDGLNQAKLVIGGPVQVYSPGYRNAYDVLITEAGNMYTWDNGANSGWGGHPDNEGSDGNVTNNWVEGEPGSSNDGPNDPEVNNRDGLHLITGPDYYGGHPNPIRANPSGAGLFTHSGSGGEDGVWRTAVTGDVDTTLPEDWPPVPVSLANPIEGDFQNAGETDGSIYTVNSSTNGLAEYTASNFSGALTGNILAAAWDGELYNVNLNGSGTIDSDNDVSILATGFGSGPLDVETQGDNDLFPGTIWVAVLGGDGIVVLEPDDFDTDFDTSDDVPESSIYINAGGLSAVQDGISWEADQYFEGGKAYSPSVSLDEPYDTERFGDFSYAIPVSNGTVEVELHFAEIYAGASEEGARIFDVSIEGSSVLNNFDIVEEVGFQTATIQKFEVVVTDGVLNISFVTEVDNAKISGIAVFSEESTCSGSDSATADDDGDGFSNSDEIDNGTSPCNAASLPADFDGTLINGFLVSNLNDPDDDDDGILDTEDKFAWDANNGLSTSIPIDYPFLNSDPGSGFYGLGFTGLMTNGEDDYLDLIQDEDNSSVEIIAGGAVGLLSINNIGSGDAYQAKNTQQNAYQLGIDVNQNSDPFYIEVGMLGPIWTDPQGWQSAGIFIGSGDQDNYLKIVTQANAGPGMEVLHESEGQNSYKASVEVSGIENESEIQIKILVDPSTGLVQPQYSFGDDNFINLGDAVQLAGPSLAALQNNNQALAVGVISTNNITSGDFDASWDYLVIRDQDEEDEDEDEDNEQETTTVASALDAPESLEFNTTTEIVTVSNVDGVTSILVEDISINNSNFQFNSYINPPFVLEAGDSFEIEISRENTTGSSRIDITHNGSNGTVTSIALSSSSSEDFAVKFYDAYDFEGNVVTLGTGEYERTADEGIPANSISSVEIAAGYTVELYSNSKFNGDKLVLTSSEDNLNTISFNNKADSIKIYETVSGVSSEASLSNAEAILYPNPSSDYVTIETNEGVDVTKLDIYDISGRMIESHDINYELIQNNTFSIQTIHLESGLYVVQLDFLDGTIEMHNLIVEKD